ncbi:hypothetical protein RFI_19445, partial [Reticulomyxa filosa]
SREELELLFVQIVCLDDAIVDEIKSSMEGDTKQAIDDFDGAIVAGELDDLLDNTKEVFEVVQSMIQLLHLDLCLQTLTHVTNGLLKFLKMCIDEEDMSTATATTGGKAIEKFSKDELQHNGKLSFVLQQLEQMWEKFCQAYNTQTSRDRHNTETVLIDIWQNMNQWQKDVYDIVGPLFSDCVRSLKTTVHLIERNEHASNSELETNQKETKENGINANCLDLFYLRLFNFFFFFFL